jgi:MoxR-like ATPase
MTTTITLDTFRLDESIELLPSTGWPKPALHHFDRSQAIAVMAAMEVNRPLLVRGEPGCGKTQVARAVAQLLKMPLALLVVNERTESEELFWRYDVLRRLSDANMPDKDLQPEEAYLNPGPLWWAIDWTTAEEYDKGRQSLKPDLGSSGDERDPENGRVLLIDEIDKADRSLPNSLLESLANFSFQVPQLGKRIQCNGRYPLVIITTNREQELPPAFERRCLVLDITLPKAKEDFSALLAKRGRALFGQYFESDTIFKDIAEALWDKRKALEEARAPRIPGQAEYLDYLEALHNIKDRLPESEQAEACETLANLTYRKFRG